MMFRECVGVEQGQSDAGGIWLEAWIETAALPRHFFVADVG